MWQCKKCLLQVHNNDRSTHFIEHLDPKNIPILCTLCNTGSISDGAFKRHCEMFHMEKSWKSIPTIKSVDPIRDFESSFRSAGTYEPDMKKKCAEGASLVHQHVNSIAHRSTPLTKIEEDNFNKQVLGFANEYLELASKIARGQKGFDKYNLIDLANQHGDKLEALRKQYNL